MTTDDTNKGHNVKVMLGWSGETDNVWRKVDVTVDDTDLVRMLNEWDIEVSDLTVSTKATFQLLQNEAETLLLKKLLDYGYPEGTARPRMDKLQTQNHAILTALGDKVRAKA